MGQYSLEHYERYPTVKCRPAELAVAVENSGCGVFHTIPCCWRDTEPEYNQISMGSVRVRMGMEYTRVLELDTTPPAWVETEDTAVRMAWLESWLRRTAAELDGGAALFAVVLRASAGMEALWDAFFEAFDSTWKLLCVSDENAVAYARRRGRRFGLFAEIGEHPYDGCEYFARYGLQQIWQQAPILVRDCGSEPDLTGKLAAQWHACAIEPTAASTEFSNLGYRLALRRLTYPAELTAGGAFPLRFWWANTGSSPCYTPCRVQLRMSEGKAAWEILIGDSVKSWPIGDRVWNEIARLPDAPVGKYTLSCRVIAHGGTPMRLAMEGADSEGYYPVGQVNLDWVPRPALEHAWEGYYPEGYYPLEDPAVPGSE